MMTLSEFPSIDILERRLQSLAVLDAMLCPEWEYRYFSYDQNWGTGETMGSIRDGSGDNVFILFFEKGCFIKEFYHERPVLSDAYVPVPTAFAIATQEPAFSPENVTFCYWRSRVSDHWEMNGLNEQFNPEISELLALVDGKPETYLRFAEDYYEKTIPQEMVIAVYEHQILSASLLEQISFTGEREKLQKDINQIGYPSDLPKLSSFRERVFAIFRSSGG